MACRTEMETRAKELIEMIASPQLLPHAVKYASKIGRMHLAEKLSELLPQLEEEVYNNIHLLLFKYQFFFKHFFPSRFPFYNLGKTTRQIIK